MDAVMTRVPEEDGKSTWYLVDLFRMRIRPGTYHALQIDDLQGEGVGVQRRSCAAALFTDRTELSDLVLSVGIANPTHESFPALRRTIPPLPTRRFPWRSAAVSSTSRPTICNGTTPAR